MVGKEPTFKKRKKKKKGLGLIWKISLKVVRPFPPFGTDKNIFVNQKNLFFFALEKTLHLTLLFCYGKDPA